jgi:hypothetical protein
MTKLLAHASGRGGVTVVAPTKGLRTGMWLHQLAGPRSSRAKATVTCTKRTSGRSWAGSGTYFRFATTAGRWHELRRYLGSPCTVEVTVTGRGRIALELRGR